MKKFGKYFILAAGFTLFAAFARVPGTGIKVHAQGYGCSVASLKGTYAYSRTGVNNAAGGPIAEIGLDVFNGDGERGIIRSTRSTNGVIQDWTNFPWPSGTYTVDPDCTGSFFTADGTKQNNVIVLDGGRKFSVLSVGSDTIVTSEAVRLDAGEKN